MMSQLPTSTGCSSTDSRRQAAVAAVAAAGFGLVKTSNHQRCNDLRPRLGGTMVAGGRWQVLCMECSGSMVTIFIT